MSVDQLIAVAGGARRWLIVAVAAQLVLVAGMLHVDGMFVHVGMDFLTSYTAAEMIYNGAATDLYDTRAQWEYQRPIIDAYEIDWGDRIMHPFIAPPILGVLAMPLLILGPTGGYIAWALLNLAAVGLAVLLLVRRMGIAWRTSTAVLIGSLPLFMVLMLGQVEGLLFLAFVVFAVELRNGRDVRSGLALAAFAIKPPLLLAPLIYLAITGRRKATWTAILAVAAQAAASILLIGPNGVREYVELSRRLSGADGTIVTNVWGMVNLRSIVVRAFPVDDRLMINATIVVLTGMTLAVACWFWRRAGQDAASLPSLALLAVTTVLTSYHALYHTTTIALIGVIFLVAHASANRDDLRVDRLTVFAWASFSLLPLLAFVAVQTSKVPAAFGVVGVALLWAFAVSTVAQQVAEREAALRPSRAELQPWYVSGRE